ncbi:MAG: head decoration protein [Methylococcales bacterium]
MTASYASATFIPDQLIAGEADDLLGEHITIISGQNRKRGDLLGKITASSKYNLSLAAATDGSQVPDYILAEDCDASAGDKQALAYSRGDFIAEKVTLGAGHTLDSVKEGLRLKNIFLIKSIGA